MSDRVNLVAPPSPIECLPYLPNIRAIQYKLGPEKLTRLGNSNVLRLPVTGLCSLKGTVVNQTIHLQMKLRIQSLSLTNDYFCLVKSALK